MALEGLFIIGMVLIIAGLLAMVFDIRDHK